MDRRVERAVEHITELAGEEGRAGCLVIRIYDAVEITNREIKKFERQVNGPKIFFCEYGQENIQEPFMPFMGILSDFLGELDDGELERVFKQCDVYNCHRQILKSYLRTGRAVRPEDLILDEAAFEQKRMAEAIFNLTVWCSGRRSFVLVLNSFQRASALTMGLVRRLMESGDRHMVHMVILYDVLESPAVYLQETWDEWLEAAQSWGQLLEFESFSDRYRKTAQEGILLSEEHMGDMLQRLYNLVGMLDLYQAEYYLEMIDYRLNIENSSISNRYRIQVLILHAYVMICLKNFSRALSLCELLGNFDEKGAKNSRHYLSALAYMHSGRLDLAEECLNRRPPDKDQEDIGAFKFRLLRAKIRMGGWDRMNFCLEDVPVEEELLQRAEQLGFYNHLAYMRIYGRDNSAEGVERFLSDETALPEFGRALAWAKSVGNRVLVDKAYCRNSMIAAYNGRNDVSNCYHFKCYQALGGQECLELARIYNGVGYNYIMLREYGRAGTAFVQALQIYRRLGGDVVREAAGTYYYMGLNALAQEQFVKAQEYFQRSMRIMGRLGIYGQRFCDLGQFYCLMALCCMYGHSGADAKVYLNRARQVLEHMEGCVRPIRENARASVSGDLFLYHYAMGLSFMLARDYQRAQSCMERAEIHVQKARPDQRICRAMYRRDRVELFVRTGRMGEAEQERLRIRLDEESGMRLSAGAQNPHIPPSMKLEGAPEERLIRDMERELELLAKSWEKECQYWKQRNNRRFVSNWIRLLNNVDDIRRQDKLKLMISLFKRHFGVDGLMFVRFPAKGSGGVYYSDLDCAVGQRETETFRRFFEKRQQGFAVSRFTGHFGQYREVAEPFYEDRLCAMAGIPFFNNNRLECAVFVVIYMRASYIYEAMNYAISEEELDTFEMMFCQLNSVICRSEKDAELSRIQEELRLAATTDQLTGILNREGFYRRLRGLLAHGDRQMGLLYIDLDNFKNCNDRFGHLVGDAVLREIAGVFEGVCGRSELAVRFGGDEFVICAPNAGQETLEELARKIYGELESRIYFLDTLRRHVAEKPIDCRDGISCSIGIACGRVSTVQDVNRLLCRADNMLYEAKKGTKGIYFVSHE